jgi:hypothetical protein
VTAVGEWTRLEYQATDTGAVVLRSERGGSAFTRTAVRRAGSARSALRLAELLNGGLREGAAYGPIDDQAELADLLLHRADRPGRVRYDLGAAFEVTRTEGGRTAAVDVPRLGSRTTLVELVNELGTAFRIGAEDAAAVPPAAGEAVSLGDALAVRIAALEPGQRLLEITRGGVVHLAVERAEGILCDCGRVGADRFTVARLHLPGGRSRSRTMPQVRELAAGE